MPKPRMLKRVAGTRAWRDALVQELARQDGPQGKALERIARIVVLNAMNGDLDCINEIANRLDGKPGTQMDPVTEDKLDRLIVQWGSQPPKVIEGQLVALKPHEKQ